MAVLLTMTGCLFKDLEVLGPNHRVSDFFVLVLGL